MTNAELIIMLATVSQPRGRSVEAELETSQCTYPSLTRKLPQEEDPSWLPGWLTPGALAQHCYYKQQYFAIFGPYESSTAKLQQEMATAAFRDLLRYYIYMCVCMCICVCA